jgi:hypothetical protein
MDRADYYKEAFEQTLEEMGFQQFVDQLTPEQRQEIGESLAVSAENESMAFYTPPASDRYIQIEREWKAKYDELLAKFERYERNAETAVKIALRQPSDARVSIGEYGEVRKYDGRSDRIQ